MNRIKIIFLGTSEATPTIEKNQTAIYIGYKNENLLIDCGEGTQRQLKIAKINPYKINRILITHWHGDHILGLPGLLQTLALNNYNKVLHIYGPKGTKEFIKKILQFFLFTSDIKLEAHEITKDSTIIENEDFKVEAYKMNHLAPCIAYSIVEKDRYKINIGYLKKIGINAGPHLKKLKEGKETHINGKKINIKKATTFIKGKKVTIILDTLINPNCIKAAKFSDILISEATFLEKEHKEKATERKHLTAKQAAEIAKKAKVKKLILTHISQRYSKKENLILHEAKQIFSNSTLAYDFLKIEV